MDMQQGMLCELTNAKADFDGTCPNYDEDAKVKAKVTVAEDVKGGESV